MPIYNKNNKRYTLPIMMYGEKPNDPLLYSYMNYPNPTILESSGLGTTIVPYVIPNAINNNFYPLDNNIILTGTGPQQETREEGTFPWWYGPLRRIGVVQTPEKQKEIREKEKEEREKEEEERKKDKPSLSDVASQIINAYGQLIGIDDPIRQKNPHPSGRTQSPPQSNNSTPQSNNSTKSNSNISSSNNNTKQVTPQYQYEQDVEDFQKWYNQNWRGDGTALDEDGLYGPKTEEQYKFYGQLYNEETGKSLNRQFGGYSGNTNQYITENQQKPLYIGIPPEPQFLYKNPNNNNNSKYYQPFYPGTNDNRTYKYKSGGVVNNLETMLYKSGGWIQKATDSIKRRGTKGKCTPITKPGCTGRAKALALTFKKMARNRKNN